MRSTLLYIVSVLFILSSCSSTKKITYAKEAERGLKGSWTISDVAIDGIQSNYVKATVFDHTETKCFVGSQWRFISNNNTGSYQLANGNECGANTQAQNIKWFISQEDAGNYFQFKRIGEEKAKNVTAGYKMKLVQNDGAKAVMAQEIPFEGKKLTVNYTFTKIN